MVFVIIILFLGISIYPTLAIDTLKKTVNPLDNGNTLYVGGTGEGNYTKIKDAIKNASDGDTVFVYNGLYKEGDIGVSNSINIIGENKNTTSIDCRGYTYAFTFMWEITNIKLSGFTIKSASGPLYGAGIYLDSDYHTICDNIFLRNEYVGIHLRYSDYNHIYGNIFKYNGLSNFFIHSTGGIRAFVSSQNIIEDNVFEKNTYGLNYAGNNNYISKNIFVNHTERGIWIEGANNTIKENNIINCSKQGIVIKGVNYKILLNNIIKNKMGIKLRQFTRDAVIERNNIYNNNNTGTFVVRLLDFIFHPNKWIKNYWGEKPHIREIIPGSLKIWVGLDENWEKI